MNYPTRKRKRGKEPPDTDRSDDRLELKLAEYSAPFGEELPWRVATEELEIGVDWRGLRPDRGRLH